MPTPNHPSRDLNEAAYAQELIPPGHDYPSAEDTELKVQRYQDQLLQLKRQQEEIERQKRELEELSRKQREFEHGRADVVEKLSRGLVILERRAFETKRELEQIQLIRENFSEQLSAIEKIHPEQWDSRHLSEELSRALAYIDQAKAVHHHARARLSALVGLDDGSGNGSESVPDPLSEVSPSTSFAQLVWDGLAYSLPALFVQVILILLYFVVPHHS